MAVKQCCEQILQRQLQAMHAIASDSKCLKDQICELGPDLDPSMRITSIAAYSGECLTSFASNPIHEELRHLRAR